MNEIVMGAVGVLLIQNLVMSFIKCVEWTYAIDEKHSEISPFFFIGMGLQHTIMVGVVIWYVFGGGHALY